MTHQNSAIPVVLTQDDRIRLDNARSPLLDNFNGYIVTAGTSVRRELSNGWTEGNDKKEIAEYGYLKVALDALAEISDDWDFPYNNCGQPYGDDEIKTTEWPLMLPREDNYQTGGFTLRRAYLGKLNGQNRKSNLGVTEIQFIRAYFRDRRASRREV